MKHKRENIKELIQENSSFTIEIDGELYLGIISYHFISLNVLGNRWFELKLSKIKIFNVFGLKLKIPEWTNFSSSWNTEGGEIISGVWYFKPDFVKNLCKKNIIEHKQKQEMNHFKKQERKKIKIIKHL
jgi:hypothetical protein